MKVYYAKFPLLFEGGVSGALTLYIDTQAGTGQGGWLANLIPTLSSKEVGILQRINLEFLKIFLTK